MAESSRMHFLDNLRAFVVLLVVVLHGSITYMAYAPASWYVVDQQNSVAITILVLLMDGPLMPIMFFTAGYFALPSLQRRGARRFLRGKLMRLGVPWVVGVLFLAPPLSYMTYLSRNVPLSLLEFWRTDFWGEEYDQSLYWFLGILLLMFLVLGLVYSVSGRLHTATPKISIPSWKLFVSFAAITSAGFLLMNLLLSMDEWVDAYYLFVFQPVRFPLYICYFVLGLYAYQHAWFTPAGYQPRSWPWGLACALCGLAYVGFRAWSLSTNQSVLLVEVGTGILHNALCLSALIAGVALFQQKVNAAGLFWRSQAANSYGIYYLHPLILYPLAYFFLKASFPVFLKAGLVILLAIILSWGLSVLLLRKVPLYMLRTGQTLYAWLLPRETAAKSGLSVAFLSAQVAGIDRCFCGAKGESPANRLLPQ
jgi:glucans biosynthesis protein C